MNIAQEDRYILADIEVNSNKFWAITRYGDHSVKTQWGRVGEEGQSKTFAHSSQYEAEKFYGSKCREKEKKGYVKQKTLANTANIHKVESFKNHNLAEVAKKQIQTNSPLVLKLVDHLSKVNVHNILSSTTFAYDESKGTFSTPLGIVTQDAIQQARNLLTQISDYVVKRDYENPSLFATANSYLMLIPQDIGRRKPDLKVLYPDLNAVQQQNGILDALETSLQLVLSGSKNGETKDEPKLFNAKLELVEEGKEIDRIRKKYKSTFQSQHACAHLDVKKVYSIEIDAMLKNFEKDGKHVGTVWELWHGTRASNLLSILKSGFVIPNRNAPHVTGAMYGAGCYFSDQSTKSLNYAYGYWGGARENNCFMLLNEVAMGKFYVPRSSSESFPKAGYDSTFAKAGQSGVMNNEMIVYKISQVNPRFLIEFSLNGK